MNQPRHRTTTVLLVALALVTGACDFPSPGAAMSVPAGNVEPALYARLFDEVIRRRGAETIFYMTWARERAPQDQAALTSAYDSIGRELRAMVAAVGEAWRAAGTRASDLGLFDADGSHPNPTGSYLAACVFYATLLGTDPSGASGASRDPETGAPLVDLNADAAGRLQAIAWDTESAH